jgi:hypothetical protein
MAVERATIVLPVAAQRFDRGSITGGDLLQRYAEASESRRKA